MLIVGTTAGRPEYLEQTLASWSRVEGIEDCAMVWFVEPIRVSETIEVLRPFDACRCRWHVHVKRLGSIENPRHGLQHALDLHAEYSVHIEDDVVVAPDVIRLHKWAAQQYVDDQEIAMVCSGNVDAPVVPGPDDDAHATYRTQWFDPHGFGTWRDRLPGIISEMGRLEPHTWDWRLLQKAVIGTGRQVLFPYVARSMHIGETGEQCRPEVYRQTVPARFAGDMRSVEDDPWSEWLGAKT